MRVKQKNIKELKFSPGLLYLFTLYKSRHIEQTMGATFTGYIYNIPVLLNLIRKCHCLQATKHIHTLPYQLVVNGATMSLMVSPIQ